MVRKIIIDAAKCTGCRAGPKARVEYVEEPKAALGGKLGDVSILWALFRDPARACNQCGMCTQWCVAGALRAEDV